MTTERNELKPCPFCPDGGEPIKELWIMNTITKEMGPGCKKCGATIESVSAWNTRHARERKPLDNTSDLIFIGEVDEDKLSNFLQENDLCWDGEYQEYFKFNKDNADLLAKAICAKFGSTVEVKITGETSDGYHTFNNLYDHRCLLWINLCLVNADKCYLVPKHFEGWFLLGMETEFGQISYHCPNKFFGLVKGMPQRHPEFDGHTSKDVIHRLKLIAELIKVKGV